jgi:penicillin-insensitive murein endopeptidase
MMLRTVSVLVLTAMLALAGLSFDGRVRVGLAQTPPADSQPAAVAPIPSAPAPAEATAPAIPTTPAPAPAAEPAAPPAAAAPPATPPANTAAPADTALPPQPPAAKEAVKDTAKDTAKSGVQAARDLFSKTSLPTLGHAAAIGYYPRGCLQGGVELPVDGPTWQVMRLSRNRNWGHPSLVNFLEKFAPAAAKATGWNGIMIGDMAQPRGGPTPFGHMSHQTGLDVDIWFMPMPDHKLSAEEREKTSAINLVSDDWKGLNPKNWTPAHVKFIKTAAQQPNVERVLVNAAIKKELCRVEKEGDKSWMAKVRPWYGHHDHIHVRLACPPDSPNCRKQPEVAGGDGCADKELAFWFSDKVLKPKRDGASAKAKPLTMADLPPACKSVLNAPSASLSKQAPKGSL